MNITFEKIYKNVLQVIIAQQIQKSRMDDSDPLTRNRYFENHYGF